MEKNSCFQNIKEDGNEKLVYDKIAQKALVKVHNWVFIILVNTKILVYYII